jgi:hypothetical protein
MLLLACLAAPAYACSCMGSGPPCQELARSNAVFTGKVIDITEPLVGEPSKVFPRSSRRERRDRELASAAYPRRRVRFEIREVMAGLPAGQKEIEIVTGMGGGDCGYEFRWDEEYVVYAYQNPQRRLETGICTRTRPLSEAAEDLAYFRRRAAGPRGSEMHVIVFDARKAQQSQADASYQPALPGASVTIEGAGGRYSGVTGANGRYEVAGLRRGEYRVDAALTGYRVADPPGVVRAASMGCVEVWIPMHAVP